MMDSTIRSGRNHPIDQLSLRKPMKIDISEITNILKQEISQYEAKLDVAKVGRVVEVGDGIARIYGLERRPGRRDAPVRERHDRARSSTSKRTRSAPSSTATTRKCGKAPTSARRASC